MSTNSFSIGDIINESWAIIKRHIWLFAATMLGFLLVYYLVTLLVGFVFGGAVAVSSTDPSEILASMFSVAYLMTMLAGVALSAIFYLGFYKMALDAADGLTPQLSSFSQISGKKILNLFIANIICFIVTYIGLILCIIPGLFIATRLQFYIYFIVEKDCNALDALSKSWEYTSGETLNLMLFVLALVLINFIGVLCCGIGVLVTAPMSTIAMALVYRRLTGTVPQEEDFEALSETNI